MDVKGKYCKMEIDGNICFWIFDAQFGYPLIEGIFTLYTYMKQECSLYG
jgi:hypothetical protein